MWNEIRYRNIEYRLCFRGINQRIINKIRLPIYMYENLYTLGEQIYIIVEDEYERYSVNILPTQKDVCGDFVA